uniref:ATPase MORC2A-like isoform X3 n=1 Tax=Pristiophorus japonicus TaxID=55135 RepID=UPI00398EDAA5
MNPNPQQNSCDLPEQLPHIPLGTLTRESVLSDERQELLEKSIRQHREKVAALQFQKTFPIKPLTYKLPSDLSNKSLSKDISASESTPFPLSSSTRKRRIPTYYARPDRRSVSSERIPLSRNKYPKPSRYRKTVRIHGKSRPAAVSSEKQSYTSVHSTEENSIEKLFMASQPIKKHLQALQKEQVNTHNFKVEIPQREFAKKTKEEIIAVPVNNVYSKDPTSSKSKYMMQALVKKEPLKDGDTGGFIYQPCFHWEVKENVIVTFGSERNLLSHFIPPNYHIPKEKLNCMRAEELVTFPLDHYFIHYEKSLREQCQSSCENLITRAQEMEQEIQQAETKLKKSREKLKLYQKITAIIEQES